MKGIKKRSHKDREHVVEKLIPLLKARFGRNFVALAAEGSYARGEDFTYSDLELTVFLKRVPKNWSIRKIINGLLVVIIPETKQGYIDKYMDVSDIWYASGAATLLPLVNHKIIQQINDYKPDNKQQKCSHHVAKNWYHFQEITAKLLNNIKKKNHKSVPLILSELIKQLLIILSYLNGQPYKNLDSYISQANGFKIKPDGYGELMSLFINGEYQNINSLDLATRKVFSSLEKIVKKRKLISYVENVTDALS